MEPVQLPEHYRLWIRRLVRIASVFMFVGICLGLYSTSYQRKMRYGTHPHLTTDEERAAGVKHVVTLPPGLMWETGRDVRISHGHVILIGGVIPIAICAALWLTLLAGGKPVSNGTLHAFCWTYFPGACGAFGLMVYKGMHSFWSVQDGVFDIGQVHASMFGGSRALRGLAYGLSHTLLAGGLGVITVALWRSAGKIRPRKAPPAASPHEAGP
jgi:hypothetical protein